MEYKYIRNGIYDDERYSYNLELNPDDIPSVNLLLILSKYNYDIYHAVMNESDDLEIRRMMMIIFENTISELLKDLKDYIITIISIKYESHHKLYFISHAERLRSKFIIVIRTAKRNDILKKFIYDNIITINNITKMYNQITHSNNIISLDDKKKDIEMLTSVDIFNEDWFYDFTLQYIDENMKEIVDDFLLGGYFHEYE